jgi:hypothetical protein
MNEAVNRMAAALRAAAIRLLGTVTKSPFLHGRMTDRIPDLLGR